MVVHFKHHCNTYGSLSAYIVALFVRLSGGESIIGLEPLIHYPGWDEENHRQLFPFRTMAMLMSLITLVGVSAYTKWIFESGRLAPQYDYFRCVVNIPDDAIRVGDPSEVGEQVRLLNLFTPRFFFLNSDYSCLIFKFVAARYVRPNGKNIWCRYNGRQRRNEWSHQSGNGSRR